MATPENKTPAEAAALERLRIAIEIEKASERARIALLLEKVATLADGPPEALIHVDHTELAPIIAWLRRGAPSGSAAGDRTEQLDDAILRLARCEHEHARIWLLPPPGIPRIPGDRRPLVEELQLCEVCGALRQIGPDNRKEEPWHRPVMVQILAVLLGAPGGGL